MIGLLIYSGTTSHVYSVLAMFSETILVFGVTSFCPKMLLGSIQNWY